MSTDPFRNQVSIKCFVSQTICTDILTRKYLIIYSKDNLKNKFDDTYAGTVMCSLSFQRINEYKGDHIMTHII